MVFFARFPNPIKASLKSVLSKFIDIGKIGELILSAELEISLWF